MEADRTRTALDLLSLQNTLLLENIDENQVLALLDKLIEALGHPVLIATPDHTIVLTNNHLENLFGYTRDELANIQADNLFTEKFQLRYRHYMHTCTKNGEKKILKLSGLCKDGREFPLIMHCHPVNLTLSNPIVCCTIQDYSHEQSTIKKIKQLLNIDMTTQLPNRSRFDKVLTKRITMAKKENGQFALVLINIHKMKYINDYYGHHLGDLVLKKAGARIAEQIRANDFLARLVFDEFAILMEADSPHQPGVLAKRLIQAFEKSFTVLNNTINLTISIGITIFPHGGTNALDLLKNADIALYKAKSLKTRQFAWYSNELDAQHTSRLYIENNLTLAVQNEELEIVYQPQINMETQKICGLEALLRWNNPEIGSISPEIFIPIAENEGLISTLGLWVFEQVCLQIRQWQTEQIPVLSVSLNLSANQLNDPNLARTFQKLCRRYQVKPEQIGLEITETNIMNLEAGALEILDALSDMGFILSIDDFGSGYSSLSRLSKIPIKTLKIDKALIQDNGVNARKILLAIIHLANTMDLQVIAEGVDTAERCAFLLEAGCKIAQGYYFYHPLEVEKLKKILKQGNV